MNGDLDLAAFGNLSDALGLNSVLSLLANVDVALQLGAATLVDDVGLDLGCADEGGILLARIDGGAVSSDRGVD